MLTYDDIVNLRKARHDEICTARKEYWSQRAKQKQSYASPLRTHRAILKKLRQELKSEKAEAKAAYLKAFID